MVCQKAGHEVSHINEGCILRITEHTGKRRIFNLLFIMKFTRKKILKHDYSERDSAYGLRQNRGSSVTAPVAEVPD
jgi:hypothetical protein